MKKPNHCKRNVVEYFLKQGYRIEGLELKKGDQAVFEITMTMKRSLQKAGLI